MANAVVGIDIEARLDGLKRQLATLGPGMEKEAKAMAGALKKEITGLTNEMKRQSKETKGAKDETKAFGDAAGQAGQGAKKLRGLLGMLGSEFAAVAGFVDDAGDAVEVFSGVSGATAAAAGGAAVALGGLALAYQAVQGDIGRAAKASEEIHRIHETLIPSERDLRDTQLELAHALGLVTDAVLAQQQAANQARDSVEDFGKAQEQQRKELRASTEAAQMWLGIIDKDSIVGGMVDAVAGWSSTIEENKRVEGALNDALLTQHATAKALKTSTEDLTLAKGAQTKATEKQTEAVLSQGEIDQQIAELRASLASRQAARQEELDAYARKSAEEGKKLAEDVAQAQIAAAEKARAAQELQFTSTVSSYGDMAGAISSIASSLGDNLTEQQKDTAMALFAIQKGAAMAQAAINTVLAVSEASTAAPYPANLALMAGAAAVGVAQEVAIAAEPPPSFGDTPGPMQMNGGGNVRLASGDYFAAAKSPRELQRQAGAVTDPTSDYRTGGPTYVVIGARAHGRLISDQLQLRGSLPDALNAGRTRPLGVRG